MIAIESDRIGRPSDRLRLDRIRSAHDLCCRRRDVRFPCVHSSTEAPMSDWLLQGVDPREPAGKEFYLHTADEWFDIVASSIRCCIHCFRSRTTIRWDGSRTAIA